MFDIVLNAQFSIPVPTSLQYGRDVLALTGCKVVHQDNDLYSEIDELNFYRLNSNDYECGRIDIELSFDGTTKKPYSNFKARCISIRSDHGANIKINGLTPLHKISPKSYTKVSKEGKLVLGLSYYFSNEDECEKILNCTSFCIEGFFSLGCDYNVYSFSCITKKINDNWCLDVGNVSRIYHLTNINNLLH